ncbi:MAG: hypothetical protein AB1500_03730 [Bacillota bacterium]
MSDNWRDERRKVWGMLLDLKRQIKELERYLGVDQKRKSVRIPEQPAKRAGA